MLTSLRQSEKKPTFYSNITNLQPFLPKAQGVQDMAEFKTHEQVLQVSRNHGNFWSTLFPLTHIVEK